MPAHVHAFGEPGDGCDPARRDILGGKGASLALLARAGLPVSPGFIISTACCPLVIAQGVWPEGLEAEVRAALAGLERRTGRVFGAGGDPLLVSVRSGAAVSMPGMMDTILNCGLTPAMAGGPGFWRAYRQFAEAFARTVGGIAADELAAIRHAGDGSDEAMAFQVRQLYQRRTGRAFPDDGWGALTACIDAVFRSWNSERAVAYRRQHGIAGAAGTAVTVQAMFPSRIAGIAFTANPTSPDADELVIEASFGLGEAVVSGDVAPDRFILARADRTLKSISLGRKSQGIRAYGDVGEHAAGARTLDDAQLAELAGLALRAEACFGCPVDVEWGWAAGRFDLLQARPIRGLDVARAVEPARAAEIARLRALAGGGRRVWTAHNLGETLPAPTPLTWDIVRAFMGGDGGFGRMYRDFGFQPGPLVCAEGFLELICGRIYADPERAAQLFWKDLPLTYDLEALAAGRASLESPPSRFSPERARPDFLIRLPATLWAMLRSSRRMGSARAAARARFEEEVLPPFLAFVGEKRTQALDALSVPALLAELHLRRRRVLDGFGGESLKPGFFGGVARAELEALLVRILGADGRCLALELTGGLDGDVTCEQNIMLHAVATGNAERTGFLERFGHRTVGEMELAEPRWREDPGFLDNLIAAHRGGASPAERHQANRQRRQAAEAALPGLLADAGGSSFREAVMAALRLAQDLLPYRENGKHYLMMGYELIRTVILELSRRSGLGRDIFFLRLHELDGLAARDGSFGAVIAERRLRWQALRRLEMPERIDSDRLDDLGRPPPLPAASELPGDAVSGGVASGEVRLVRDPHAARDLGSGYILVCPSTDPGWTPLLLNARGLVIERGGVLSHGAIIARDFGIPAVVCPGIMRRLAAGDRVRVDGDRGMVAILGRMDGPP
jgi:pyruvate,water dikinase